MAEFLDEVEPPEEDDGYIWEKAYARSWDVIQEVNGVLKVDQILQQQRQKRKKVEQISGIVRRGIIRYLFIVLDLSDAIELKDMRPSRAAVVLSVLTSFIREYFDQNPLSQIGIIITRNRLAEMLTSLSGNTRHQIQTLDDHFTPGGDPPSLQNSLNIARGALSTIPQYGSKEVLVIYSSLSTYDPGDLDQTIAELKRDNVRVSIIGLGAEMFVCKKIAQGTGGSYNVPLNEEHFKELVLGFTSPPPTTATVKQAAELIKMGFPKKIPSNKNIWALCTCHRQLTSGGYICPRCNCKYCDIPTVCRVCNLTLVSSPHLARSYHHLFPVPQYIEVTEARTGNRNCSSCLQVITPEALLLECPSCHHHFCVDCDTFIHDSLHNCPSCCK